MKKIVSIIMCMMLLALTACSAPSEPTEPEQEPLFYSTPIYLMAKKSSNIKTVEDFKDKKIAVQQYFDTELMNFAVESLKEAGLTDDNFVYIDTYQELPNHFNEDKVAGWILPDGYESILNDYRYDYQPDEYLVITQFSKPYYEEKLLPDDIANDPLFTKPFAFVINGLDGIGDNDADDLRNDVTHVMVVDPVKKHILTISIPRDSRVYNVDYNYYDKLTHINIYGGPETIVASLSALLDINIEYYCITTFDHFCDIINLLGGVWIDVPMDVYMDMDSHRDVAHPYEMSEGYKKVYGEWALALARNRKYNNIAAGDFSRIRNQALIIDSIIKRIAENPFILDICSAEWYFDIMTNNNFTGHQKKVLIELAKTFNEGYTIDNYFISGYDSMIDGVYFMSLDDASVAIASGKAQLVLNGKIDEDNIYYEQIMKGYVTGGAGVSGQGGNSSGFIGSEYDLSEIYK